MAAAVRLLPLAISAALVGCGAPAPSTAVTSPALRLSAQAATAAAPAVGQSPAAAPVAFDQGKTLTDPVIRPIAFKAVSSPETDFKAAMQAFAGQARESFGDDQPLLSLDEVPAYATSSNLEAETSFLPGFTPQAKPETTQARADKEAYAWASDAKMIYVGWGFAGRSSLWKFLGQSRHVYYSPSQRRLLYLDYNFFRMKKSAWQSRDIALEYGGKVISAILNEPRGEFPFNGREAYDQATKMGYVYGNRTYATIKGVCLQPLLIGPQWFFMDVAGKPTVMVDAVTGQTRMNHWLMEVVKLIFSISR